MDALPKDFKWNVPSFPTTVRAQVEEPTSLLGGTAGVVSGRDLS